MTPLSQDQFIVQQAQTQDFPGKTTMHTGMLPIKNIKPNFDVLRQESGPLGTAYRERLLADVKERGVQAPLRMIYGKKSERSKPSLILADGHHRLWSAKQAGIEKLPVVVESWYGRPPELED